MQGMVNPPTPADLHAYDHGDPPGGKTAILNGLVDLIFLNRVVCQDSGRKIVEFRRSRCKNLRISDCH
jgi:hypothetical protein